MKTFNKLILLSGIAFVFSLQSCKFNEHTLTKYHKPIYFAPLERSDFEIVGGLTAEATVDLKGAALSPAQAKNYKDGNLKSMTAVTSSSAFAVTKKYITTFRYDGVNDLVQSPLFATPDVAQQSAITKLLNMFKGLNPNQFIKDYAMDFALYTLMEKYPDMDYFTNVTIERYKTMSGKKTTETLKIKAHGIELKTDE